MMIECKCDLCGKKIDDGMIKGKFDIFITGYLIEMRNKEGCDFCLKCIVKVLQEEILQIEGKKVKLREL